ncbi:hypothetical protein ONZ45_g6032 [Pleurotus djamor]|nr:hypothetical protein ONZ45_g6032 [Pleurotus djamor]
MTAAANSASQSQSAAIFKLPDDVLSLIFLSGHVNSDDYDEYDDDDYEDINEEMPDHATLASLEHGRTLASLWANVSLDKPGYATELVIRTKEAPLGVFCIFPSPTSEAFWEGVLELLPRCMDRMQSLHIVLKEDHNDERFWSLLSHPQALQRLIITGSGYPGGGIPHSLSQNVPLDRMCSLTSLSLNAVCLQQDLPPMPALRRLIIRDNSDDYTTLPNIPNVEIVDAAIVSIGLLPATHRPQLIKLRKLQFLKLFCTDVTSTAIFEFLDLSQTVAVEIMFDYKSPVPLKTHGMAALLARYQRNPSAELGLFVRMDINDDGGEKIIVLLLTEDEIDCPTLLATYFWREMFPEYVSILPLERLHTLEYAVYASDGQAGPTDLWIEVMVLCPNLCKLVLKASAGIEFLREYTERYFRSRDPEKGAVNPQLSHITFKKVNFEVEGETTKEYTTMLESLDKMKQAKLSIELSLDHCNISEASVTNLRERTSVEWDKNERGVPVVHRDLGGSQ